MHEPKVRLLTPHLGWKGDPLVLRALLLPGRALMDKSESEVAVSQLCCRPTLVLLRHAGCRRLLDLLDYVDVLTRLPVSIQPHLFAFKNWLQDIWGLQQAGGCHVLLRGWEAKLIELVTCLWGINKYSRYGASWAPLSLISCLVFVDQFSACLSLGCLLILNLDRVLE